MKIKKVFPMFVSVTFIVTPIVSRGMDTILNVQNNNINNYIENGKDQENEDICAICNYPLSKKDDGLEELHEDSIELKCGHTFGYGCLQSYFAGLVQEKAKNIKSQSIFKLSCPLCKCEASDGDIKELLHTSNLFANYLANENSEFYKKLATSFARRLYSQEKILSQKINERDYRELEKKFNKLQKENKYLRKESGKLQVENEEWKDDCFRQMDKNVELNLEYEDLKEKYEINEHSNELSRWSTKAALLFALGVISFV